MNKQKGQSLVEFALMLVFFVGIAIMFVDVAPFAFDLYMAKQLSARGARAGSIYLADGIRTCEQDVIDAIGDPMLPFATYAIDISEPCDNDPYTTIATGTPITVSINVIYEPLFTSGAFNPIETRTLPFTVQTVERAR